MQASNFVWHYTVGTRLSAISESGCLIPARFAQGGSSLGVVWFSRRQTWEPSAAHHGWKRHPALKASLPADEGLFRFGLPASDARLVAWPTVTRLADIDIPEAMVMVSAGLRRGANPTDWLGALSVIALSDLLVQRWDGEGWRDVTLDELDLVAPSTNPARIHEADERTAWVPASRCGTTHDAH